MTNNKEGNKNKYSVTDGALFPSFIMFLLPLIAASCLMQSYTIADGLILGNAIDQEALGSVNSVSSIIDVCILVQIALAGGCSIMVSHLFGAGKFREVKKLVHDMTWLITLISVIIAVIAFLFTMPVLRLLHTPESLIDGAATYMRITFIGVPFMALYSLQAGILRGMGDSKRPLGGIAVSSGINIGLDLLFVVLLKFGIAGAAIATVSAEGISSAYLYYKLREKTHHLEDDMDQSSGETESHVGESIRLGSPQIVQSLVSSGGKVLLQNITNIMGDAVVIGVAVAFKVDSLLMIPLMSIGTAVAVFTGQNIGASKPERVRGTMKYGLVITLILSLVMSLVLWKFGYPMFSWFGLGNEAATMGYRYLVVCLPFYWIFGLQFALNGYLNGAKHTVITSAASIIGLIGRVAFAYLGYSHFGSDSLPLAEALSWIIAVLIDIGYFTIGSLLSKQIIHR